MDMKKLKGTMWSILTNTPEVCPFNYVIELLPISFFKKSFLAFSFFQTKVVFQFKISFG